jgi:hypothetical protein
LFAFGYRFRRSNLMLSTRMSRRISRGPLERE